MKRLIIATMLAMSTAASAGTFSAAMNEGENACLKPIEAIKHPTQSEKNTLTTCLHHAVVDVMEKYDQNTVAKIGGKKKMLQNMARPQKPISAANKMRESLFGHEIYANIQSHYHPPHYGKPEGCVITVHLTPDGHITGMVLSSSTGDKQFNLLAERAVKEVGQFKVPAGLPYHFYKTATVRFANGQQRLVQQLQQQRPANAIPCSKPGINTYMRRNFDNWAQDSDRSYRFVHTMPVLTVSGGPHTTVCEAWIMEKVPNTGFWYKNLATIWVHHKPGTDMDYTRVSGLN